jgi:hypothetical protein
VSCALNIDPWDYDMLEELIDELHRRAFPDPSSSLPDPRWSHY